MHAKLLGHLGAPTEIGRIRRGRKAHGQIRDRDQDTRNDSWPSEMVVPACFLHRHPQFSFGLTLLRESMSFEVPLVQAVGVMRVDRVRDVLVIESVPRSGVVKGHPNGHLPDAAVGPGVVRDQF